MKKLLVKVCGLTRLANIEAVSALDVDMLGFIFYPPSPRFLAGKTRPSDIKAIDKNQQKIGVFVNETASKMRETAQEYGLHALQLHGQESPEICSGLRAHVAILKAFPIATADDFELTKNYAGACDYFLFDTKGPAHGGNGFAFDWNVLEAYSGDTPFLLSGGIAPGDAFIIKQLKHPRLAGVDLNSRFETGPGVKDVAALEAFIKLSH